MRKFISLAMVLAMLVSVMSLTALTTSASYFDEEGYEEWPDGNTGYQCVEALYFENEPTIDGSISEAEWGESTVYMSSTEAASMADNKPYYASFFYWVGAAQGTGEGDLMIEYELWLRWDENNYYVGVKVNDYDGHSLRYGKNEAWNGDAIQFRVDPEGNNVSGDLRKPWSEGEFVPDIMCGYSQIAGGFFECYDNANGSEKGLTEYSNPFWGAVDVAVAPAGSNYSKDTAAGYTTYEIAIPWKYIFENADYNAKDNNTPYTLEYSEFHWRDNPNGGIGVELGMSLTVLNAEAGKSGYNSYLSWGSGVAGTNNVDEIYNQPMKTCTGSNLVVLSDASVDPNAGSFDKYDPSVLEKASGLGSGKYDTKFYDYLAFDLDKANPITDAKQLTTLTYDDDADMEFWGSADLFLGSTIDVGGEHGKVLNYDRALVTETDEEGNTIVAGVDPVPSFYIATEYAPGAAWTFPLSYTIEWDVMFTSNDISAEGHAPFLGNWFGGASSVEYQCGYSFNDRQFIVSEALSTTTNKMASYNYELEPNTWYNWKFQYDNDTCVMRLLINDEVIFNVYNRYFYYTSEEHQLNGTGMYAWFVNTQCKFDNVKIYNFYDYVNKAAGSVTDKPGSTGPTTSTEAGGDKIDTDVTIRDDGKFAVAVTAKALYKTVTQLSYTFAFNADDYEFVGIEGLEEGEYTVEEKDGVYTITINNLKPIKAAKEGDKLFDIVFSSKTEGLDGSTLDLELADSFKYTVTTGDSMVWIIAAAVLMMASAGVVVVYKKRKATDLI